MPYLAAREPASSPEPSSIDVGKSITPDASLKASSTPGESTATSDVISRLPTREAMLRNQFEGRRPKRSFQGLATYYHDSLAGNLTACGEPYEPMDYTAAHRTLPFGTVVRVVHPSSGRDVFVRVNDRGPFASQRHVLDLSRAAAGKIGLLRHGVMKVRVEVLDFGDPKHGRCGMP